MCASCQAQTGQTGGFGASWFAPPADPHVGTMHTSRLLVAAACGSGFAALNAGHKRQVPLPKAREAPQSLQCHEEPTQVSSFRRLDRLWQTIAERQANPDTSLSWTSRLLAKGPDKCAQKVGEEGVEVCIEAAARRTEGVVKESADLLFHLLVLWASMGISPKEVLDELARREGTSGVEEKASRPK